jgi:hypothetical protein
MTHLEAENLASEYLEGELEQAQRADFEGHLGICSECRGLVAGVRRAIELCRSAEELVPAPWLASKILLATVGQRKPALREQLASLLRPAFQPRIAYVVGMAVFSFSIFINTAGLNLRNLSLRDLDPRAWVYKANRTGHLLYARAEKFCYDLRVVYELESRFRKFRAQPEKQQQEAPSNEAPAGRSTDRKHPGAFQLASISTPSKPLPRVADVAHPVFLKGSSIR